MVRVEDITEEGIARMHKKALCINDLRTIFGKDIFTKSITGLIDIWNKEPFVYIGSLKEDSSVFVLENSDYLEQIKRFGEIYENRTKRELVIQTDYSTPPTQC